MNIIHQVKNYQVKNEKWKIPWIPRPEEIPDYHLFVFLFQGQKTEAEKFFLKAIELDPTKGNCYMHYGW